MTAPKKPAPKKPAPPLRRVAAGPLNQSAAAGQAAPPSAAATSPLSGAIGADGPLDQSLEQSPNQHSFMHDPVEATDVVADEPDEPDGKRAGFKTEFTKSVRSGSMPIERGGSVDREVGERMAADAIEDPDELRAEIARIRGIRKPIGAYTQKLALPLRSGYHRHWFNDTAGRIEEAENNGWTFVKGNDGKPISRCVGSGRDKGALYAFAMEIPEVFWLEDMAAQHKLASDKIEALKASPFQSKPGQAQASDKGKFYDPSDAGEGPLTVVKGT